MKSHPQLLTQAHEIRELAAVLIQEKRIAFDTEFIRESTFFPQIELIQVATEQESWIVDARAFKKAYPAQDPASYDSGIQPLLDVFHNPSILKIVHAAQGDQEAIYLNFQVLPQPLLDTAIAASLCGLGQSVGLGRALKEILGIHLLKGHARTNWSARPLSKHFLDYAHGDVVSLIPLWDALGEKLDQFQRREWALSQSALWTQSEKFEFSLMEVAQKGSRHAGLDGPSAAVFLALLKWREHRAQQLNLPRRWLAEDSILMSLAQVKPSSLDHLASFRGLNRGEIQKQGSFLLNLIQEAQKTPLFFEKKGAKKSQRSHPSSRLDLEEETQIQALVSCFIQILAKQHHIASHHLLSTVQILDLLRSLPLVNAEEEVNVEEERWMDILSVKLAPQVFELIGRDLCAFLLGRTALVLNQHKVEVMNCHGNEYRQERSPVSPNQDR